MRRREETESESGKTESLWMATAKVPEQASLTEDAHADVCVVGAGIAGMTTAYLLGREGKSVLVLDAGRIGGGMTGRTTAHLSNAIDDRYFEIERLHGGKGAMISAQSHTAAIDRIAAIVAEEEIECGFERLDGFLFAAPGSERNVLERELEAVLRAGLADVGQTGRAPIDSYDTGSCLRFPGQAQFHPLEYLSGLTRAIKRDGGRIYTGTHAVRIRSGKGTRVETGDGAAVSAHAAVIATNTPINDIVTIHAKQAAYTTYAIGARIPRGSVTKALYWDTADPYHYVRVHEATYPRGGQHDFLIVGGEDHKSGQANDGADRYSRLESWARKRFPMIEEIEYRWSGQVMEPADRVAFIGRNPGDSNVYVATGDSGMGMTHGTIAGILITDLIMGRENPWVSFYDPSRKTLRALPGYLRENINVAAQYIKDYFTGGVRSANEIAKGEGAIVRRGVAPVAVYRDEKGTTHEVSAICPHLGCVVRWNGTEKTWDCPCHGSRFDRFGHVMHGPAVTDLEEMKEDKAKAS